MIFAPSVKSKSGNKLNKGTTNNINTEVEIVIDVMPNKLRRRNNQLNP
ncbi:MAG: hypothetical protein ACTSX4_02305 [Candidatus Helarchaeota archaeon]